MLEGRRFYKMSGSGNDFIFFDLSDGSVEAVENRAAITALSSRGTGIGGDGVVFFEAVGRASLEMRYYNSDGSRGELCGNATLCALRLGHRLGKVDEGDVAISTDAGVLTARMVDGLPEIDLAPVTEVATGHPAIPMSDRERRLGFVRAGVPHIVIVDSGVETADVVGRGRRIRMDRSLRDGANVNFLSRESDGWAIRTYERGVEGETLACGTGAVASGILLTEWGESGSPVSLLTRSGRTLDVRVRRDGDAWYPSLRGAADLVFTGELGPIFEL